MYKGLDVWMNRMVDALDKWNIAWMDGLNEQMDGMN